MKMQDPQKGKYLLFYISRRRERKNTIRIQKTYLIENRLAA